MDMVLSAQIDNLHQDEGLPMRVQQPMKSLLVGVMLFATHGAWANQQSDICALQATRGTRSRLATDVIARTCWKVYDNGRFLMENERSYYSCLLQALRGTENDAAAQQVISICQRNQWTRGW